MDSSGWMIFHIEDEEKEAENKEQILKEAGYRTGIREKNGKFEVHASPRPLSFREKKMKLEPTDRDIKELET